MQTSMGKGCADVFNQDSLEQIKSWADTSAEMLMNEAKRLHKAGGKLADTKPYLADMDAFRMLSAAIMDVRV